MTDAFDLLEGELDRAEQSFQRVAIGKLSIGVKFLKWANPGSNEKPAEVTQDEYINLDPKQRSVQYVFGVNVQEFAPHLQFNYERNLSPGSADWNKSFAPSVESCLGNGSMQKANASATLRKLNGSYVEATEVPQQPRKGDKHLNKQTGEPYTTISITKVFASREEAYTAYVARFGEHKGDNGNGSGDAPMTPGEGLKTWAADLWPQQWGDIVTCVVDNGMGIDEVATAYGEDKAKIEEALVWKYAEKNPGLSVAQYAAKLHVTVPRVKALLDQVGEIPF